MHAYLRCRINDNHDDIYLGAGDLIGRSERAVLCLDDPRISEVHAMLSLRGNSLMMLALRGRFRVQKSVCTETRVVEGLKIELAPKLILHCLEVVLPEYLLGIQCQDMPPTLLTQTTSVFLEPVTQIQPGFDPNSDLVFWMHATSWRVSVRGGSPQTVEQGDILEVGSHRVEMVSVPLKQAAQPKTRRTKSDPLRLEVSPHSVRVVIQGQTHATLITGVPGKMLAAIAQTSQPQSWEQIADHVWADSFGEKNSMRTRFDVGMKRLRNKLENINLPKELIVMDGSGMVSLKLSEEDRIVEMNR